MKKIIAWFTLVALAAVSAQAQGLFNFSNGSTIAARIYTNNAVGGPAWGPIANNSGRYYFALYYSKTATSVNGTNGAIAGLGSMSDYVVFDTNWVFAGYGTNLTSSGQMSGPGPGAGGAVVIPGIAGGSTAQFVVIGWSASFGPSIGLLQSWLSNPTGVAWVGQSAVSGPLTLGNGSGVSTPSMFGTGSGQVGGFTLGLSTGITTPSAPFIISQPTNVTATAGSHVAFTVTALGNPTPSYQWTFNETNIDGATSATLNLYDVQLTNAGNYAVTISNSNGTTNSGTAVLTVQTSSAPPYITAQPVDSSEPAGSTAEFSVAVSGAQPINYQWSFNGTNLDGATSALLMLTNVQTANAGQYAVAITNAYGFTNSYAATLTVTSGGGGGSSAYVIFANNSVSATKIFTNSTVSGPMTGLTATNGLLYRFALFASATATAVNGQTSPILGGTNVNYAFNDTNWTLVTYGTNVLIPGRLLSTSYNNLGYTPIAGFTGGTTAQFVVIGWSTGIGLDIPSLQTWFNNGNPGSDGWIGQSAVSGAIRMGNGVNIFPTPLFSTNAPQIKGFTLGLASPNSSASYSVPATPPAIMRSVLSGGSLQLSWPSAAGNFGVQSATLPGGPWSDTGLTVTSVGSNSVVIVPAGMGPFFRLVTQ